MSKAQGAEAGALVRRLAAAPRLSDPKGARARLAECLRAEGGRPLAEFLKDFKAARAVLEGVADGSPYLWDLVESDPGRLLTLLKCEPDAHLAALLSSSARAVAAATRDDEVMRILRRMKAEAALLIALADIGGVWDVMHVTRALTDVADTAVAAAVRHMLAAHARGGKLAPPDPARPEEGSGYVVLAMGKMGAYELNYSSDIDLIIFYDPAAPALASGVEPGALYVRMTRALLRLLQERTADGYVFRVDVRLRPDPASTQIAVSVPAALEYYESRGQNWERAALIKARICAGDRAAGASFIANLSPFIWRKYLDFVALSDIHEMKRQIHAYRGHSVVAVEGHNIKLGRGGIREIEFFVQTQQLIAGGRNSQLRSRETLVTLRALADGGWIDRATCADLQDAYRFLRTVEHRLQMVADEQTHTLPSRRDDLDGFARFLGYNDRDALAQVLLEHLRAVQSRYASLFEHASLAAAERRGLTFPPEADT